MKVWACALVVAMVLGGLIGFGTEGTTRAACLGAGVGPVVLAYVCVVFGSEELYRRLK